MLTRMNCNFPLQRCIALLLILAIGFGSLAGAAAQTPAPGAGVTWRICKPNRCFTSQAEKDQYAAVERCRFVEDVCTNGSTARDDQGPPDSDASFWGSAWNKIKNSGLKYGYDFVKGLAIGIKDQIVDLWDFITNLEGVMGGLYQLGKAFYEDPRGTVKKLGQMMGQEAVDTLTRATQCGAFDLGRVVGTYVSPALVLKVATRLTKFGGNLDNAVKSIKRDLGCASFSADTLVFTPQGVVAISSIRTGQLVLSRDESTFADAPRAVTQTFARMAPGYRLLESEADRLRVTDEHPLWVQGKGWTEAKEVMRGDVVAGAQGDMLVRTNLAIHEPIQVHNFSVEGTPSYFVGAGLWVHNSGCDLPPPYRAPPSPSGYRLGASDGGIGEWNYKNRGTENKEWMNYETQITGAPRDIEYTVNKGVKTGDQRARDFDGYDSQRNVLLEAKRRDSKKYEGFLLEAETKNWLDQAIAQRKAVPKGQKIEWHFSDKKLADHAREAFNNEDTLKGDAAITVVYTPDIVN